MVSVFVRTLADWSDAGVAAAADYRLFPGGMSGLALGGSGEECRCLAVQAGEPHNRSQAFAAREIEGDDLVLCDAVETAVGTEAEAARFAEFGRFPCG